MLALGLFLAGLVVWTFRRSKTSLRLGAILGLLVVVCVFTEFQNDVNGELLPSVFSRPGVIPPFSDPDLILVLGLGIAIIGWLGWWFVWSHETSPAHSMRARFEARLGTVGVVGLVMLCFLLGVSWARSLVSPESLGSTYELRLLLYFGIPFLGFVAVADRKDCRLVWLFLVSLALLKGAEALQRIRDVPSDFVGRYSLFPGWGETTHFVLALLGVVVLLAERSRFTKTYQQRTIVDGVLLMLVGPFVLWLILNSFRRSFFLGLLIGIPISLTLFPLVAIRRMAVGFGMALVLATMVVLASGQSEIFLARFESIFRPAEDPSLVYRVGEYRNVMLSVQEHPILGLPFGVPWKATVPLPFAQPLDPIGVHNVTLWFMLKAGVIGGLAFLVLVASLGLRLRKALVSALSRPTGMGDAIVLAGCITVLVSLLVASMTAPLIAERKSAFMFGLFLGMAAVYAEGAPEPMPSTPDGESRRQNLASN